MVTPEKEVPKLDEKRRKCTLSEDMQKLMLRQLIHEHANFHLYRSFANFYGIRGYAVLEKYYIERAEEEKKHGTWIYNYLSTTDTEFIYPEIPAVSEKFETMVDPFRITVDKEISTTQLINEMVELAAEEGDWATWNWLMADSEEKGRLVNEQVEEENLSRTALDIAEGEGSWYRKEKSIYAVYTNDLD